MLQNLFAWLSSAISGNPWVAIFASFVWGVLSIILSPCHLSSIPLIVGFIDEQGRISTKRAFWISLFFSGGILLTIAVIGLITALMGRMMGDIGKWGNFIIAGIFFLIGLHLLDLIPLPIPGLSKQPQFQKKGLLTGFLLGLIFGIALGPCTFAYMAPMLGVVFDTSSTNLIFGASLLFFYGIGHCSVIVFAGTFTEILQRFLKWNEKSKGTIIIKKICGVLVILGGIYMIVTNL